MDKKRVKPKAVRLIQAGQTVPTLTPVPTVADGIFGFFAGKGVIIGDVISPARSAEEWASLY